ncbi:Nascent polypeptide-associated complex subunit beta [Coemansia sp. RSA 1722]|nr:Nascent polypeptide-associated complex subunit beta [Coemansia sp. RSA 485]KAJ2595746.1 Nascent polypeptide-associated complex subunit beta [Coemansia sp. RSA 1722]KAJ2639237.1 Nascent polypeptide-associated complex subunit beta [Coemansia sp. RSA 1286]KAJ2706847.1 Nascent polypeptide-associated complex subunit beta [Coemansia sp. IMI 203386]
MNPEKLAKLQAQARIGGKGTPRRKVKKAVVTNTVKEDPKLASTLRQLNVQPIPEIASINMFKEDGKVIGFNKPRLSANPSANTFVINGRAQEKTPEEAITEMFSGLGNFGPESLSQLAKLSSGLQESTNAGDVDDDIPELISSVDESASKNDLDAAD